MSLNHRMTDQTLDGYRQSVADSGIFMLDVASFATKHHRQHPSLYEIDLLSLIVTSLY